MGIGLEWAALGVYADDLIWHTGLDQAQAEAKTEKKFVLLFFHGSDWCPSCIELQKQVLDSPEFISYARKALVLVNVDFPEKAVQSPELKQANEVLKMRFNVGENFPTLVLLDQAGATVFQEAGYNGGGLAEILPELQRHAPASAPVTSGFKDVDVAEFAKLVADKQNVILDVRTPREFAAGHIAGAINLNVMAPDFAQKAAALDKSKTYLVHCASGIRSTRACKALAKLDFPSLYNLTGGFQAWESAGETVVK